MQLNILQRMKTTFKLLPFIFIFALTIILFYSCKISKQIDVQSYEEIEFRKSFRIMFYNVENLFDTIADPVKNDKDFTPEGSYRWTSFRYYKKLQDVSKVIIAVGGWELPELIGLCEVENRVVLEDLINKTPLRTSDLNIIHKESPDARGIDVALLYRESLFKVLFYDFYEVRFAFAPESKTRDILYAKGVAAGIDTLHIFVNHWPSRRGGKEVSEPRRIAVAEILRSKVDSIFKINPLSNIVIMGDFNDEPYDKSIIEVLKATDDSLKMSETTLFNMIAAYKKKGLGTYKWQYEWNLIDQIIVSAPLTQNRNTLYVKSDGAKIFTEDWLLEDDKSYPGKKLYRTYLGPRYIGGISDHLPVFVDLLFRNN